MIGASSVTLGLVASDFSLISSDYSALIDSFLASAASSSSSSSFASSIEASMLIDRSASFANLTLFLSEVGVLISFFSSFGCYSASLPESDSDSLSQLLHVS